MSTRSAIELADLIRDRLREPELRVAVYAGRMGWHARVYASREAAAELQRRVDTVVEGLRELYELEE
jgi:hypothetical protein